MKQLTKKNDLIGKVIKGVFHRFIHDSGNYDLIIVFEKHFALIKQSGISENIEVDSTIINLTPNSNNCHLLRDIGILTELECDNVLHDAILEEEMNTRKKEIKLLIKLKGKYPNI